MSVRGIKKASGARVMVGATIPRPPTPEDAAWLARYLERLTRMTDDELARCIQGQQRRDR